jgi:hypothetical protein
MVSWRCSASLAEEVLGACCDGRDSKVSHLFDATLFYAQRESHLATKGIYFFSSWVIIKLGMLGNAWVC